MITYVEPIELSIRNVSIFQIPLEGTSNPPILRQTVSGQTYDFVNVEGNTTVKIRLLETTFNQPKATYCVLVYNNFVRDMKFEEPLYGIESRIWHFNLG